MKKIIISLLLLLSCTIILAQDRQIDSAALQTDIYPSSFKLYPTKNIWTFLKLDTRHGKIWQVQFNTSSDKRFESELNTTSLLIDEKIVDGRFELYPTENMYNFILLDRKDGRTWQVQWSINSKERLIIRIR